MKRTSVITLAIVGALAASGCVNQAEQPTSYSNLTECVKEHDYATCKAAEVEAKKQTEAAAPKFASAEQCQAQFSSCTRSSSGDWFMPAVMGYMVGSMMNNGSRAPSTPIYYDRDRRPVAASYSGGVYRPVPAAPSYSSKVATRSAATTSSRGGFGARSSSSSS